MNKRNGRKRRERGERGEKEEREEKNTPPLENKCTKMLVPRPLKGPGSPAYCTAKPDE